MKKSIILLLAGLVFSSAHADIRYCSGTNVTGSKHRALQQVIQDFVARNNCKVGTNCILNYEKVKYHIAWEKWCLNNTSEPRGTTFICTNGQCTPWGASYPASSYDDTL